MRPPETRVRPLNGMYSQSRSTRSTHAGNLYPVPSGECDEEKGSRDAEVFPCSLFLHGADGKNVAASEFCEVTLTRSWACSGLFEFTGFVKFGVDRFGLERHVARETAE